MLIQNNESVTSVPKEILDLNGLENALKSNPMIKTAEVYLTVSGEVQADINQRKPIARVSTNAAYYIDDLGAYMPLSKNYTARVPLVTGFVEKNNLGSIFTIANKIENDDFLKNQIVEIHQNQKDYDSDRTDVINSYGIKEVRFTNDFILFSFENFKILYFS